MFDPTPKTPWSGNAWASSPNAQTIIPVSSTTAILVTPGEPGTGWIEADPVDVDQINLRTYGWADRFLFGASQELVSGLRRKAKRRPALVVRPREMHQVLLVEADPDDSSLADARAARGLPAQFEHKPTGARMDYFVLGEDGESVDIALETSRLAKQRTTRPPRDPSC